MKKWIRLGLILLTAALIISAAAPARAEVMTIGVWLRGVRTAADGSQVQVPLNGSFRVLKGGLEEGVIAAGENTIALYGEGTVVLEPMPETFSAGWDLSGARMTLDWTAGHVTVPVLLPEMTEESARAAARSRSTSAGTGKTGSAVISVADGRETDVSQQDLTPDGTIGPLNAAAETPKLNMTPVPTAVPTPEPEVGRLLTTANTGTFHIKVFYDSNNNGGCSIYEKGISGIPVYLVDAAGEVVTGGNTGADGEITLSGLKPGNYRIRVSLPEKWGFNRKSKQTGLDCSVMDFSSQASQDSAPVAVAAGQTVERGVGLLKGVVVSGICWLDQNANGIMESGEPRIAGARVTLNGQKNGLSFEAYTDADGKWIIHRVRAGFYDFTGYAPEGMMFTRYSKTGGKNRSVFTTEGKTKSTKTLDLNDGEDEPDQNIGFAWQGSISGMAFLDENYNGLYDEGERPLPGVKVTAIKQLKDEEIAVAYSGEDGRYILSGLRGNTYTVRAVLPEDGCNFTRTVSDSLGNHFTARESRRENFWKDFELRDGENRTVNVGAIYYGSVSGTVYQDDDFSGTLGGGEKVVQGISVSLLDARGNLLETKQTGPKGTYSFTGLTPGTYSLQMTAKEGYAFTRAGTGSVILNRTGGDGYSESFEVPLGIDVLGKDAGMIRPAKVSGRVFADLNDNGLQDSGEGGLSGAAVRLMGEEGEVFSASIGENGDFLFDAVMPGNYYLSYELPAGGIFAQTVSGGNTVSGENGQGRGETFQLRTGDEKKAPLCGGLTLGTISGTVFADHDGSGIQDSDEESLENAALTLIPSRSDLTELAVTTREDGSFRMENLHPDRYTLVLTLPEGMVTSRIGNISLPVLPGQNSQEIGLKLAMGQEWTDQTIGAVRPARLSGAVWLDENNDGIMDDEELRPEGYAILLTDSRPGGGTETLLTDREGRFEAENLAPGEYSLLFRMNEAMDAAGEGDSTFRKDGSEMVMTGVFLTEDGEREDMLLGLVEYTALGGTVWTDRGGGAEELAGAEVQLLDEDEETLSRVITDEDGTWRFSGLMPGTYLLRVELPEGSVVAEPDDERLDSGLISVITETAGRTGVSDPIEVRMGQDQLSLDIGSVLPGTIGDICWLDENGNGYQDGGEYGIPHVRVELMRNGVTAGETETDQYGLYFFREVYPAVYTLRVTAPAEVKPTVKKNDIPLISSSLNETEDEVAETDAFAVASDSTDFNIDLGYTLRNPGVYPAGYGEQETMDWSKTYADQSQP